MEKSDKREETRGRKTVITPEVIQKLEQAFSLGCTDLEACFHAGIGKSTLYDYQKEHPEFLERKEMLKDKLVLQARSVVAENLKKGDKGVATWYLERKKKAEFSTRVEQDVYDADRPIVVDDVKDDFEENDK